MSIAYFVVNYLNVSFCGLITSVGGERADFCAIKLLVVLWFLIILWVLRIFCVGLPYAPRCEKTGLRGFRPGPTQTGLYNHTRWLEA